MLKWHGYGVLALAIAGSVLLKNRHAGRFRARFTHRLRSCLGCIGLVLFSGTAAFGQVAVDVELIPDKPGPYIGGERVVLDVWIRGHANEDLGLRVVQLDFSAPRCFVWVPLGDPSPKPPGIYRVEASPKGGKAGDTRAARPSVCP